MFLVRMLNISTGGTNCPTQVRFGMAYSAAGDTVCTKCVPGKYSMDVAVVCIVCTAGTYSTTSGASSASTCTYQRSTTCTEVDKSWTIMSSAYRGG